MKFLRSKKLIIASVIVFLFSFSSFSFSLAACDEGGGSSRVIEFCNPLKYNTVDAFLGAFIVGLQAIVALVALTFLALGGFFYMTSAGNEEKIQSAKKAVTASMIGLAIGVGAPSLLREIYIILGATPDSAISGATPVYQIYLNVLNFILSIAGITAIVMLVIAGIIYLTAAGSDDRIEIAKRMTKWSIIGIVIILASLIIVKQITGFFA